MKHILTVLSILGLAMGSSFAGCGKTTTSTGKLKSYDKETKAIVIVAGGKEVKTVVKASTTGAADVAGLVGKNVTAVISVHGYAELIAKG